MLTYTTIFIASLILAVVGLVLYRVITASSESVLNSKGPVSLISSTTNSPIGESPYVVADAPAFPDKSSRIASANVAGPSPVMPAGDVDWGWQTEGNQIREQNPHHGTGGDKTGHCSLYDVNAAAASSQRAARPHREEKLETGGKAYKVTREATPQTSSGEGSDKPWGW